MFYDVATLLVVIVMGLLQALWWYKEYPAKKRLDHKYEYLKELASICIDLAGETNSRRSLNQQMQIKDTNPRLQELKEELQFNQIRWAETKGHRYFGQIAVLQRLINDEVINKEVEAILSISQGDHSDEKNKELITRLTNIAVRANQRIADL